MVDIVELSDDDNGTVDTNSAVGNSHARPASPFPRKPKQNLNVKKSRHFLGNLLWEHEIQYSSSADDWTNAEMSLPWAGTALTITRDPDDKSKLYIELEYPSKRQYFGHQLLQGFVRGLSYMPIIKKRMPLAAERQQRKELKETVKDAQKSILGEDAIIGRLTQEDTAELEQKARDLPQQELNLQRLNQRHAARNATLKKFYSRTYGNIAGEIIKEVSLATPAAKPPQLYVRINKKLSYKDRRMLDALWRQCQNGGIPLQGYTPSNEAKRSQAEYARKHGGIAKAIAQQRYSDPAGTGSTGAIGGDAKPRKEVTVSARLRSGTSVQPTELGPDTQPPAILVV